MTNNALLWLLKREPWKSFTHIYFVIYLPLWIRARGLVIQTSVVLSRVKMQQRVKLSRRRSDTREWNEPGGRTFVQWYVFTVYVERVRWCTSLDQQCVVLKYKLVQRTSVCLWLNSKEKSVGYNHSTKDKIMTKCSDFPSVQSTFLLPLMSTLLCLSASCVSPLREKKIRKETSKEKMRNRISIKPSDNYILFSVCFVCLSLWFDGLKCSKQEFVWV